MKVHRAVLAVFGAVLVTSVAAAKQRQGENREGSDRKDDSYKATILVSNEEDEAPLQDPLLKNAWGIAAGPMTPWWVADNGTGMSTLYTGDGAKVPLEVKVDENPTGVVFNTSATFALSQTSATRFLFVTESGFFLAWDPKVNADAVVVSTEAGAIYKGLAIHGDTLYTTNFGDACEVEAYRGNFFDNSFHEADLSGGFRDESIPKGYCPFGIQAIGDSIFVTYALKKGEDDVAGIGHGFVREFDSDGNLVAKVGSHGLLDSPWGLALAPESFGKFGGCLLVGNFGNGQINAFCRKDDADGDSDDHRWHHAGRLRTPQHHLLVIDGLWGIGFGNGAASGSKEILYFAAGPDDEENGYFGKIEFQKKK